MYTEVITVPLTIPTDWYDSFFAMTITHWEKQDLASRLQTRNTTRPFTFMFYPGIRDRLTRG